jgi:hypothetical protein
MWATIVAAGFTAWIKSIYSPAHGSQKDRMVDTEYFGELCPKRDVVPPYCSVLRVATLYGILPPNRNEKTIHGRGHDGLSDTA